MFKEEEILYDPLLGQKCTVEIESHYIYKYNPLESLGLVCRYLEVVATLECPKVCCTKEIGAPASKLWEAWQCLNQWLDT